jgi:hypothetical protein
MGVPVLLSGLVEEERRNARDLTPLVRRAGEAGKAGASRVRDITALVRRKSRLRVGMGLEREAVALADFFEALSAHAQRTEEVLRDAVSQGKAADISGEQIVGALWEMAGVLTEMTATLQEKFEAALVRAGEQ